MKPRVARPSHGVLFGCLLVFMQAPIAPATADVISREPGHYPFVSAAYAVLPAADIDSEPSGSTLQNKENQLAFGFVRFGTAKLEFDLGLDYQYTRYVYENIDGRNRDLHRIQIPLGFSHRAEIWSLTGFVAPGLATSSNVLKKVFDRVTGDDALVTGRVEAHFQGGRRIGWLAGLAHDRAFGEQKLYPVLGLTYRPDEELAIRLAYPDAAVRYSPGDRHRLTLRLFPAGFEWHVVTDDLADEFDYRVEALRLQGVWSYRFARSAWLDLSLGYEFDRQHRFVDDAGRQIDSPVGSMVMFSAGLRWGDGPVTYSHEVVR
jgi:hypothetical protein